MTKGMLVRMDHARKDSLANLRTVFTTIPITIRDKRGKLIKVIIISKESRDEYSPRNRLCPILRIVLRDSDIFEKAKKSHRDKRSSKLTSLR